MLTKKSKQDEELEWIDKRVKRLIWLNKIPQKNIYLFGVSIRTRKIIQVLRKYGLEPKNVLDNDKNKQNSHCARIKVISVDQIENILDSKNVYIVGSSYWREMTAQLERRNVKRSSIHLFCAPKKVLLNHLIDAEKGKYHYRKLIKKYGDIPIFICPYTGTGDIYLIGTFWRQYIEQNRIENYIFVVINEACKKVAMMFGIKNIELTKKKRHCTFLLHYYLLCPDKVNIVVLNDSWPLIHSNPIEWFRGYKGLHFTEMFRRYVFALPENIKPEHPVFANVDDKLSLLFEKVQLVPDKTVVLSPYSNTLADLPDVFWEALADGLKNKGFSVCTNSSGENEPAIFGTTAIFVPLNIVPQFISKSGYFIGVRSGLCDVISAATAKKIILYDAEERFFNSSSFEYFSLKRMGLSNDVVEIIYKHGEPAITALEIINLICYE
ncbi:MAG: hypothetical protein HFG81_07010 [Dorea sp.]|jgi:hypothetical protein|uniref:hypothetical protein n=1 Tax=Sporofaciens musculi TaxID=2681861 RepID=UPI00216D987E|nr:hypothetical protein [Sporofaciens musculi]MCI9422451.1 hypothetical protein [Dorea sp.]